MNILKSFLKEMGFEMSEFYSGKYKNIVFETTPLDFRRIKPFRHIPYWTGQKVKFKITINSDSEKDLLNGIPIGVTNHTPNGYTFLKACDDCVLSENGKEVVITTDGLRGSHDLRYYFGTPSFDDSVKVVELQGNWRDKKWFIAYGLIGGFLGSLIIFILGLMFEFIKINPFWEATLIS